MDGPSRLRTQFPCKLQALLPSLAESVQVEVGSDGLTVLGTPLRPAGACFDTAGCAVRNCVHGNPTHAHDVGVHMVNQGAGEAWSDVDKSASNPARNRYTVGQVAKGSKENPRAFADV